MKLEGDQVAIKCCEEHWQLMEKCLDDRGMAHLISRECADVEAKYHRIKEHGIQYEDPLLEAMLMMAIQTTERGVPPSILATLDRENVCPVCLAMKISKKEPAETEEHWTGGLADCLLEKYRERGLLPKLN